MFDFRTRYFSEQRQMVSHNEYEVTRVPRFGMMALDMVIALVVIILLFMFSPFSTVPTGYRGVVTTFGAISGEPRPEGLVIHLPWSKLHVFNVRAETADVDGAEGSTSDQQPVKVSLTVRYSISPDKVSEVFEKYSRDGNLDSYISTATQEVFKAVTAKFTAPDLIAKRALVSAEISTTLKGKIAVYGAQVINIDMRNFSFSESYMKAINEKTTQEQLKLAENNKTETIRAREAQKLVIADADAAATRSKADAAAYATVKQATAEADALTIQNKALSQNKDVLDLRRIEVEMAKAGRWNGVLPQNIYAGAPVPFLNIQNPAK